jgi:hypothetical protein
MIADITKRAGEIESLPCLECDGNGAWEQGVCVDCMGTGVMVATFRYNPRFRHIICFLKHGGEKMHAIWLANKLGEFSNLMEAKRWVEGLSHPEPISIEGWLNRDKSSPNTVITRERSELGG